MIRIVRTTPVVFATLLATACNTSPIALTDSERQALRTELLEMEASDQRLEHLVLNQDPAIRDPGFYDDKQAQQDRYAARCREIFLRCGYPGADMVGKDASEAFWLLVQHADRDPDFQEQVAAAMVPVVASGNARGQHLAYLTDRVRVNTGRKQLYGTQTMPDGTSGGVRPKPIEEPQRVDERRKRAGLEPLWQYINDATEMHFRMNEKPLRELGIASPPLLPEGYRDW